MVSGREGVMKPDPTIFLRLLGRFYLAHEGTLMIDDTQESLDTASELGFQTIRFDSPRQLRTELEGMSVLPVSAPPSDEIGRRGRESEVRWCPVA